MAKKRRKRKSDKPQKINPTQPAFHTALKDLYSKRVGGKIAIQGFLYQTKYSNMKILEAFGSGPDAPGAITLEGFEDLDYSVDGNPCRIGRHVDNEEEYFQVKYTSNKIDASGFWKKRILQNFADMYALNPRARFVLVTNLSFRSGELQFLLLASKRELSNLDTRLSYWQGKMEEYIEEMISNAVTGDWENFEILEFFSSIRFEVVNEDKIDKTIVSQLIRTGINTGNEELFLLALSWNVFCWSRERKRVTAQDFHEAFERVKRNIGKGIVNPAIKNRWVEEVDFQRNVDWNEDLAREAYFSGKAAKPLHISSGYPVERETWKDLVLDLVYKNNAVVLRASSGQGKSTLAWQSALELKENGFSVLELIWCEKSENVGSIVELLDSYLKSGRRPLVVIDGLNTRLRAWGELVKRCAQMPVSFLVTTREEDWRRYPAPEPEIKLQAVEISLSEIEAKKVFERFKDMGRVHYSVHSWQSAWEQVKGRCLLLEYTYLLSFGTMIKDRIKAQVHELQSDSDGAGKLEILRLISFADLCEVKVDSSRLLKHVNTNIGFQGDRGRALEALHKEYHILIEEGYVIEGLHPVRSKHLTEVLHESGVPRSETALNLFGMIESEFFRIMVTNCLPHIPEGKHRIQFIKDFSNFIQEASFEEKNALLEGFLAFDAREYVKKNQETFDELYKKKLLQIVLLDACPWGEKDTLDSLLSQAGENETTTQINSLVESIQDPVLQESNTFVFLLNLGEPDISRIPEGRMKGLGHFIAWRNLFDLQTEKMFNIDYTRFRSVVLLLGCEEASHLAMALSTSDLRRYLDIFNGHEEEFLSLVKEQAEVFTIQKNGNILKIEYPARTQLSQNVNDQSVDRLYKVASFYPGHVEYNIFGIYAPFPLLEQTLQQQDPSHKKFKDTKARDIFHPQVNGIWFRECMKRYEFMTYFEWQERIFMLRKAAVELAEPLVLFILGLLEGSPKRERQIRKVDIAHKNVKRLLDINYEHPNSAKERTNEQDFKEIVKPIIKWENTLENVNNQFLNFFRPNENHMFRVAHFNAKHLAVIVPKMQRAFQSVSLITKHFFSVFQLEKKERRVFPLLAKTVVFLFENNGQLGIVRDARLSVCRYYQEQNNLAIRVLKDNLDILRDTCGIRCHLPIRMYDDGTLKYLLVGVEKDVGFTELHQIEVIKALCNVASKIDVTYIDVIFTIDGITCQPNSIRYSKDFFLEYSELISGDREELTKMVMTTPLEDELLRTIPAIKRGSFNEENISNCNRFFESAWHVSEARQRLNMESSHEVRLYKAVKKEYEEFKKLIQYAEIVREMDFLLSHEETLTKTEFQHLYKETMKIIEHSQPKS